VIEADPDADMRQEAWCSVGRQWLSLLASALGSSYATTESDHFQVLAPTADGYVGSLIQHADRCRARLFTALPGVADLESPGKQILITLRNQEDYYRYVSRFHAEGEYGGSGGMHIREGYPHIVAWGKHHWMVESTLAHELTHAVLHHLFLPQWLEEGLAQMFEHDLTGRMLLSVDAEMAAEHKLYWGEHGLDEFWNGIGFSRPEPTQKLSYQLAEILVRLLVADGRPRWFGWVKEPQRRLFSFLRDASESDCGDVACRLHLGFGVGDLAARFLGSGKWAPEFAE
jgi:hypothetical protein